MILSMIGFCIIDGILQIFEGVKDGVDNYNKMINKNLRGELKL